MVLCPMGSTESGTGDFSVGSIVWVRRRNGSWWPGKIVGPEELSASHLTSPRSGTPVKLLGREDASVDWYNLEKSKRVKAFRCGEFDDCIEKAESSQGMPIKKREKYARREDAILHALDLEKELLRRQGKIGISSDCADSRSSGGGKKRSVMPIETLGNDSLDAQNSKQNQLASRLDTSHNNEITCGPLSSQIFKEGNQLNGVEAHSEVDTHMRGLQGFGLRSNPSMGKLSSSGPSNGSRKPTIDNSAQAPPHGDLKKGNMSHINGNDSLDKRKRSHEGLSEEFLAKKHDKCRPLVHVLQSSAKLEVPDSLQLDSALVSNSISVEKQMGVNCRAKRSRGLYLPTGSSESLDYKAISESDFEMSDSQIRAAQHPDSLIVENITGFMEDESDASETDSSGSDSSETEPEMDLLSDAAVPTEPGVSSLGSYELLDHQSLCSEEPDESALSGGTSHLYSHDPISANEAVSKWQLKGKRNIRNLYKRSLNEADGKTSIYGACSTDKDFKTQMIGLDNGYSLTPRAALKGRNSVGRSMIDWDDWTWEDSPAFTRYWETRREHFTPVYDGRHQFGGRLRSMLMDVDLKVQASYQKASVPIVSLTSKLNGKAIIGHPIKIEALEDGTSSTLLSNVDYFGNETIENYGNASLPHAWRTARRTANFRVPRPHLTSSSMDGDESAYCLPFLDRESKQPFKKSNAGNFSHKAGVVRRNALQHTGISPYRKLQKASKKVSSSFSQKTRTLSSIPNEHYYFRDKPVHVSCSRQMDGLMKPESSGPTTVACIPIKLVFSRLLEKINRPPS